MTRTSLYIGRIAHKGKTYDGQHPPIIDPETWDAVRARIAAQTHVRFSGNHTREPSPLAGKLLDHTGVPMTPSYAVKSGRRYRYYVSRHLISGTLDRSNPHPPHGWRLPVREIERFIADAVMNLLADRSTLTRDVREPGMAADGILGLLGAAARWKGEFLNLVKRIDLTSGRMAITLNLARLVGVPAPMIRHTVSKRIKRRGVEMRLVIEGAGNRITTAKPDPALVKAVVRAHTWFDDLVTGCANSLEAIGQAEGLSDRYVGQRLPLAFLAPEIVEAVLAGTQPVGLTAETLIKRTDLPVEWAEQKTLLSFA